MTIHQLNKVFHPKTVAVIGASQRQSSVGHIVLKNLAEAEFKGQVFPVNPKHKHVGKAPCYPDISQVPASVDLAIICTPAVTVPSILDQCGQANVGGAIILSAGFREVGERGEELQKQLLEMNSRYPNLRIIGPNCLGIIATHSHLNASFAGGTPEKGQVAFISQSGALCTSILDWSLREHLGFSYFVSIGNTLDVDIGDLIDYFALDPWTKAIILYVESITQTRKFMSAARAFSRNKPIIVYKAGRFAQSSKAAASHTGAMAGVDAAYQAAFDRAGIVRVQEIEDIFSCTELLAQQKLPKGPRLAIVTNAGGPGVIATDALLARKGVLAEISAETSEALNGILPPSWSHGNPIDILGDADPQRLAHSLEITLADPEVDAAIVLFSPQAMSQPTEAAKAIIEVAQKCTKPVLACWMGGKAMQHGMELFQAAGLPSYQFPEEAVKAFMYLVSYSRTREVLYETPREIPVGFTLERGKLHGVMESFLTEGSGTLSEIHSKALLEAYDIPVSKPHLAQNAEEAVVLARRAGFPVAMKLVSPQITHKTDAGGVKLGISTEADVRKAFDQIVSSAHQYNPDARVDGVSVQPMIHHPSGVELLLGARSDPTFGPVILVGAGGTTAEIMQDRALELPPLSERLARRMLESLRIWPLLCGYRGNHAVNIDKLIEVLLRLSYLVTDYPEIQEIDINPLLVTPDGAVALDARIVMNHQLVLDPPRRFSHLAIRPYPEDLIRCAKLKSGAHCLLRPIKPEDEPLWHDFLAGCSQQTLWFRFRCLFKEITHEMATRFCFVDYDREIAIVVELEEDSERKIVGVGRLVADADHTNAEFAVVVADDYQNMRLGSMLTDYCLEICEKWKIDTIYANTSPDNQRMLSILQRRHFEVVDNSEAEVQYRKTPS